MRFAGFFNENDIPRAKRQVVARLEAMEADNWRALEGMSIEELDALRAEAEGAYIGADDLGYTSVSLDNPHDRMIARARAAISDQRFKVRQAIEDRKLEQIKRRNLIAEAAHHIGAAVDLVEAARQISRDPEYWAHLVPRKPQPIDVDSMTDGELRGVIRECDEGGLHNPLPAASLFALLNTPASKALADELKEQNEAHQAKAEMLLANRAAARVELDKRKVNAAVSEARKEVISANLDDIVIELENRIKELEASR